MYWASMFLAWISGQIGVIIATLVAIFTGLYWRDARRSFFLEVDRVVLWYRLEEAKGQSVEEIGKWVEKFAPFNLTPSQKDDLRNELGKMLLTKKFAGEMAFFDTLTSKSLRLRLKRYERREKDIASDLRRRLREQEQIKKGK